MDVLCFALRWFWMTHFVHLSGPTTDALLQKERRVIETLRAKTFLAVSLEYQKQCVFLKYAAIFKM